MVCFHFMYSKKWPFPMFCPASAPIWGQWAFTNYVDNILPIIDHLAKPCWYLRRNVFTEIMKNLQSVEISTTTYSTTYLPTSSFQHSLWTPPFGRKRNRAKKGKKTLAKAFQKVIRAISEYVAYKRKCPSNFLFLE